MSCTGYFRTAEGKCEKCGRITPYKELRTSFLLGHGNICERCHIEGFK